MNDDTDDTNPSINRYEAKLEARRRRLTARARGARANSVRASAAVRQILDVIPMGQPILVGHHSEARHRRDLAKVDRNLRTSIDESNRADELERRADAVGTAGISSDDPEALVKLRAELAKLTSMRELEKRLNADLRKRAKLASTRLGRPLTRDDHVTLIADMAKAGAPGSFVKQLLAYARAFPWLPQFGNHTAANARRIEERITALERRDAAPERRHEGDGFTIEENKAENRCQISFDRKPPAEVRTRLDSVGFRWARSIGVWQRQLSNGAWYHACCALGVDPRIATEAGQPTQVIDAVQDREAALVDPRDTVATSGVLPEGVVLARAANPEPVVKYPIRLAAPGSVRKIDPNVGDPIATVVALGFPLVGVNMNPSQRAELQGAPRFRGLAGPMWDGDGLRYECPQALAEASS